MKRAILGSRKKILFVESELQSLDARLYEVLFLDVSVMPKAGCGEVISAVKGMKNSENLHHVEAFGLIDDLKMKLKSLLLIKCLLWMCIPSNRFITVRKPLRLSRLTLVILSKKEEFDIMSAKKQALDALKKDNIEPMVNQRCFRLVRSRILEEFSKNWKFIWDKNYQQIKILLNSLYPDELKRFKGLVKKSDLGALIVDYPIRESPVFRTIAEKSLGFASKEKYEWLLIGLIQDKPEFAESFKKHLQLLPEALSEF